MFSNIVEEVRRNTKIIIRFLEKNDYEILMMDTSSVTTRKEGKIFIFNL